MKILHVCLANFYIDNYSYQENMLTKFHKEMGHEVEILASLVSFDKNGKLTLLEKSGRYINEHSIPVTRLRYKKGMSRLRRYKHTYHHIQKFKPDIIFIHGCQFLDIDVIVKYLKVENNVQVFVDNHADFSNSARTWISKNVLHKVIWRRCAKVIEPYASKFYGVLPARVKFLEDVYKVPTEKTELLVMGADDHKILDAKSKDLKVSIREKYNIKEKDFVIITGGKIDNAKLQTFNLLEAVRNIERNDIKVFVFGSVIEESKARFDKHLKESNIHYLGWLSPDETYHYFHAADIAVFPGRHSVLWEQAVAQKLPIIVKYWEGTTHIDLGGNCTFLYQDTSTEIESLLKELLNNNIKYRNMKQAAVRNGAEKFLYSNIADKSIRNF